MVILNQDLFTCEIIRLHLPDGNDGGMGNIKTVKRLHFQSRVLGSLNESENSILEFHVREEGGSHRTDEFLILGSTFQINRSGSTFRGFQRECDIARG